MKRGGRSLNLLMAAASLALVSQVSPVGADDFAEVASLVRAGAPSLALRLIDQEQPAPESDAEQWRLWEQQRIHIYRERDDLNAIVTRLSRLPPGTPDDFVAWVKTQAAAAYLARGDGAKALRLLDDLIKSYNSVSAAQSLLQWRRMLVQAYLADGKTADALTSMLRYQRDYVATDQDWNLLRARVYLLAGRPADAEQSLMKDNSAAARPLYLLARLRSGSDSAAKVQQAAIHAAHGELVKPATQKKLWLVSAMAAGGAGDQPGEINGLSQALALPADPTAAADPLFSVDGDHLWQAFWDYGQALGNRMGLPPDHDSNRHAAGAKVMHQDAIDACALFSVVALGHGAPRDRKHAHEQIANLLLQGQRGVSLLRALYVDTNRYATADDLPEFARRQLADSALAHGDMKLAAYLVGGLPAPPAGANVFFWKLRRARILILGGDYSGGISALRDLIDRADTIPRTQLDRMTQVIFDLQSVGQHQDAIDLFNRLPLQWYDRQLRREVLFWTADSYKALGRYEDAARLYLRSAVLLEPDAMDSWAQTAHYQAAEVLTLAGLREDARDLYTGLLEATQDAKRQAMLRNKLQQLWLKTPSQAKSAQACN